MLMLIVNCLLSINISEATATVTMCTRDFAILRENQNIILTLHDFQS